VTFYIEIAWHIVADYKVKFVMITRRCFSERVTGTIISDNGEEVSWDI
jgi:hypothetical protein